MIAGLWFLVITLCTAGGDNECHDYIVDGDMSCQHNFYRQWSGENDDD